MLKIAADTTRMVRLGRSSYKILITILLVGSIVVAHSIWTMFRDYYEKRAQTTFGEHVDNQADHIRQYMQYYENVLRSGIAFFQGSGYVSRQEWHVFVRTLHWQEHFSGCQGIGFAAMMAPSERQEIQRRMRREGYASFAIRPAGVRDVYSAILYLEPMDRRNLHAIGYDMFSEPVRREAMVRARDTGMPSVSRKVTLVQEIDKDVQAGFLMYMPLYRLGADVGSVEARRKALIGFVYSPFRMNDFMRAMPGHDSALSFSIRDEAGHVLYRSADEAGRMPKYTATRVLAMGGQQWTVSYASSLAFERNSTNTYPVIAAFAGLAVYVVGVFIIVVLLRNRAMIKRQNEATSAQAAWLGALLDASVDGIYILDSAGRLVAYSPSFLAELGYTEHEVRQLRIYDWDDRFVEGNVDDGLARTTCDPTVFETIHRRKDGSVLDVEITTRRITINDQDYVYASARNISERKKIQEALQAEKELAQNYLDIVDVMILVLDKNKKVSLLNRRGCEIIGYGPDEVLGQDWVENFLPERVRAEVGDVRDRLAHSDQDAFYHENPVLTKSGDERIIAWHNTPLFSHEGVFEGILCSGEDITQLRQTQRQLAESEHFYRTIVESVGDGIIILDKTVMMDCNDRAAAMFGQPKSGLIGRELLTPERQIECGSESLEKIIHAVYRGDASAHTVQCTLVLNDELNVGKILEISLSAFGKETDKLLLIVRDVTQKLAEEKFFRLQARQMQMGEMIAMIAHQWRQPLSIVSAITGQLRVDVMLDRIAKDDLADKLVRIDAQVTHLSQTISDFRNFFRLDKPQESLLLSSLVRHGISLIDHALKTHTIHVDVDVVADCEVVTYQNELLQVLIVLFKNSMDAFEEHQISERTIRMTIDGDARYGIMTMTDNAGGIDSETIGKIFLPYFTTKEATHGTGLGLYMSKQIIEDHCHGHLEVSSTGDWTTFVIKLPLEGE